MRTTSTIIALTATLVLGVWVAIEVSPWPSALAIRYLFDSDAWRTNAALAGRVPAGVEARRNQSYDPGEPDAARDRGADHPLSLGSRPLARSGFPMSCASGVYRFRRPGVRGASSLRP